MTIQLRCGQRRSASPPSQRLVPLISATKPSQRVTYTPQGSLKTGQSGSLQNRTTVKARDIDVDRGPYRLCRHEQCLERRKETTSHRTGKARMVFTKDRARNRCST